MVFFDQFYITGRDMQRYKDIIFQREIEKKKRYTRFIFEQQGGLIIPLILYRYVLAVASEQVGL